MGIKIGKFSCICQAKTKVVQSNSKGFVYQSFTPNQIQRNVYEFKPLAHYLIYFFVSWLSKPFYNESIILPEKKPRSKKRINRFANALA